MEATELHVAIMSRGEISLKEADLIFQKMKSRVDAYENPEQVLWENGFEGDYMFDLLGYQAKDLLER